MKLTAQTEIAVKQPCLGKESLNGSVRCPACGATAQGGRLQHGDVVVWITLDEFMRLLATYKHDAEINLNNFPSLPAPKV